MTLRRDPTFFVIGARCHFHTTGLNTTALTCARADCFLTAEHRYLVLVAANLIRGVSKRLVRVLVNVFLAWWCISVHVALHWGAIWTFGAKTDFEISEELCSLVVNICVKSHWGAALYRAALGEDRSQIDVVRVNFERYFALTVVNSIHSHRDIAVARHL